LNIPGFSHGFRWTDGAKDDLLRFIAEGNTIRNCSEMMSIKHGQSVTYEAVGCIMKKQGWKVDTLKKNIDVKTYKNLTIPMDDYMISCDIHAPYYSELWANRFFLIAEKFRIRKHILAGDLYDFNFASKYPSETPKDLDKEVSGCDQAYKLVDNFDTTYFIQGNHERRIGNYTEGTIKARHIYDTFGLTKYNAKIVYSLFDRIQIEDKYMIMHPSSYSQVSTAVSKRMAEKYSMNILNAHGHFCGLTFDRSGKYLCVDLGGLFEIEKIEYCSIKTTTHPLWNNGFGMIRNGKFTLFHPGTDWDYWLGSHEAKI